MWLIYVALDIYGLTNQPAVPLTEVPRGLLKYVGNIYISLRGIAHIVSEYLN